MKVTRAKVYNFGGQILGPGDIVAEKFVTVVGTSGLDFAVYRGDPVLSDEDIAMFGDKVSADMGRIVAPYCLHLTYRS